MDSLCKDIYVEACGKITNANIFTPNDDGVNDFYYFFDSDVCDSSNIKIVIYNRWGQEFYRYPFNELYSANDTSKYFKSTKIYTHKYWNGFSYNIGPQKADNGIYFILIESPYERKTKSITLVR
jgi:gliding motility-associated-like protein